MDSQTAKQKATRENQSQSLPWENATFLEEPRLLHESSLKFQKVTIDYLKSIPQGLKPKSMNLLLYIRTGYCPNKDHDFRICIEDGDSDVKKWVIAHAYKQNAWSYHSEQFQFPVGQRRVLSVKCSQKVEGNSKIELYIVSLK